MCTEATAGSRSFHFGAKSLLRATVCCQPIHTAFLLSVAAPPSSTKNDRPAPYPAPPAFSALTEDIASRLSTLGMPMPRCIDPSVGCPRDTPPHSRRADGQTDGRGAGGRPRAGREPAEARAVGVWEEVCAPNAELGVVRVV